MLIVENGTGLTNANSYASVAEFKTYATDRGLTESLALSDAVIESSLIKASDYLEANYYDAWKGTPTNIGQSLAWPRDGVYIDGVLLADNVIPQKLKNANIELAIRAGAGSELLPDEGQRVKREKVDVLEVEYNENYSAEPKYPLISRMLAPFLESNQGSGINTAKLTRV